MASLVDSASVENWSISIIPPVDDRTPSFVCVSSKSDPSVTFRYPTNFIRGITYPPHCEAARWEAINESIKYRSSDVIVVTYPKCGTTWAEQATLLLLNGGDKSLLNPASKNTYIPGGDFVGKIWPEACIDQNPAIQLRSGAEFAPITMADFDTAPEPRVIKSHAPPDLLLGTQGENIDGLPSGTKVVVVSRNPLDACVSAYYHAWNPFKSGWPFEAWAASWLAGNNPHGSWFNWVKEWSTVSKSHPDKVLWIQYEDLKSDPMGTVQHLADFLGVGDNADLVRTTVEDSSFDSMKEQASHSGGDTLGHLRKGTSGDWRNHFSERLAQDFKDRYYAECAGSGLTYSLGHGEEPLVSPP